MTNMNQWTRIAYVISGGLLVSQIRRSKPATWLWAVAGLELIRFGWAGKALQSRAEPEIDIVDLASELSFPASDPPAY
jgi:hypothetical protein